MINKSVKIKDMTLPAILSRRAIRLRNHKTQTQSVRLAQVKSFDKLCQKLSHDFI